MLTLVLGLWKPQICLLLCAFSLTLVWETCIAAPYHGSGIFLGHIYWNNRYSTLNHPSDWSGFWNNYQDGRRVYARQYSAGNRRCQGCSCSDVTKELTCSGTPPTTLHVSSRQVLKIKDGTLPTSLTDITIYKSGLEFIADSVFHKLSGLTKLNLASNSLQALPDVSQNGNLLELDLYKNKIKLWNHNFTDLPKKLKRIILTDNELDWIPDGWFNLPELEYISLSVNKLKKFPASAFVGVKLLKYIGIDNNNIELISYPDMEPFFGNNSQLVHLNASWNAISSVSSNTFQHLTHLQVLELHNNEISSIGSQVFYSIPELLHLDLRHNKLKVITGESYSPAFEDLPKLKCLILMQQKLKWETEHVMFNAFKNLPALEDLWLNNNKLTDFPHASLWYEERTTLKYLHVENNQINSLVSYSSNDFPPDSQDTHAGLEPKHKPFEKTKGLQRLFVHNNRLSVVNEEDLWELSSLSQLYMGQNTLKSATLHPEAFTNLTNLLTLHLDDNNFHYVPEAIIGRSRLPSVNNLDLKSNRFTYIMNGTFSDLTTLGVLDLASNQIVVIENGAFPSSIGNIQCGYNRFNFKHENQFSNLPQLTVLNLQNNLIDVIPDTAFHGLTSLQTLILTNNKIGRITKLSMRDLTRLSNLYMSNNELAYIEEGALAPTKEFRTLQLQGNHLTTLPIGGDFHNKMILKLDVSNNRITSLRTHTFVNVTCTEGSPLSNYHMWSFIDNNIAVIEAGAFFNSGGHPCRIQIGKTGSTVNPLKSIAGRAFEKVTAGYIYLQQLQLTTVARETFVDVNVYRNIEMQNNLIETVEDHSFIRVRAHFVDLDHNKIQAISGPMWGDVFQVSAIHTLDLQHNLLKTLHEKSLYGVKISNDVVLNDNKLTLFPSKALQDQTPTKLDMSRNQIGDIPVGNLDRFTRLDQLILADNNITTLGTDLFKMQTRMWLLRLERNAIGVIAEGAFNGATNLQRLELQTNQIVFLPTFPSLPKLNTIYLWDNLIENIGQNCFGGLPKLNYLNLGGSNKLGCDCNMYNSLVAVIDKVIAATCNHPARVAGVTFGHPRSYAATYFQEFICTPTGLKATAPGDFQLKVTWEKPKELYPQWMDNSTGPVVNTWNQTEVKTKTYSVTCKSDNAPTIVGVSSTESIVFTQSDGVKAGTDYTCYVMMTVEHRNGTNIPPSTLGAYITRSTPKSEKDSVTTLEGKAPISNTTVNTTNFYLDATYFDFKRADGDFVAVKYEEKYKNPQYMASPYSSWLAISNNPIADSFSKWFLPDAARNMRYEGSIELKKLLETDANGNNVFRHYNGKFFPVDGRGFGAEGQTDCYTKALRNYGFTTTVKSSFNFSGQENFAFAGGEELWVFINKQMVTQIFHDPLNSTVPCRAISLAPAAKTGGGVITPLGGSIVNGKCQVVGSVASEAFNLNLRVGEVYRIDLFLAERFPCDSALFYETSGVNFVRQWEATNPVDFLLDVSENLHVGAVVLEFEVADVFSTGPYTVEILSGNRQKRFEVKADTYSDPGVSSVTPPPSFTWRGETVFMCQTAVVDNPIPEDPPGIETFNIITKKAKLVLKQPLNYEITKSYVLDLRITDTGISKSGNISIKV